VAGQSPRKPLITPGKSAFGSWKGVVILLQEGRQRNEITHRFTINLILSDSRSCKENRSEESGQRGAAAYVLLLSQSMEFLLCTVTRTMYTRGGILVIGRGGKHPTNTTFDQAREKRLKMGSARH